MTHRARFAGVANDPGGARAILPVLELLQKKGCPVACLAAGPSIDIASREFSSIPLICLNDNASQSACRSILTNLHVEVLLSAAGAYNRLEHTVRLAANSSGIPVVALLDSWWSYRQRFERVSKGGRRKASWPDHICAIDKKTRADLLRLGMSPERITVTGAPNLERALERSRKARLRSRSWRHRLGIGSRTPCAIFFSEPSKRPGKESVDLIGRSIRKSGEPSGLRCSPLAMVELVASTMAEVFPPSERVVLVVKPHPAENLSDLQDWVESKAHDSVEIIMARDSDPAELFNTGDMIVGLTSVTLLEAALNGKPVVSVQVIKGGRTNAGNDNCVCNRLGLSVPVYSRRKLREVIRGWRGKQLEALSPGDSCLGLDGAANRVAEVVESLAAARFSASSTKPLRRTPARFRRK